MLHYVVQILIGVNLSVGLHPIPVTVCHTLNFLSGYTVYGSGYSMDSNCQSENCQPYVCIESLLQWTD